MVKPRGLNWYLIKHDLNPNEKRIVYKGIPLDYTVDTLGNVYSYKFINTDGPRKLAVLYDDHDPPYCMVNLMLPNKREKIFYIHKLVANAFIPNDDPVNKVHINHKSGIKTDNSVANLEWCTAKENMQHAVKNNLHPGRKGEKHHNASIDDKVAAAIRDVILLDKYSCESISKIFNVSPNVVRKIKDGSRWTHITDGYNIRDCKFHKDFPYEILNDDDVKQILANINLV